MSPVLQPQRLIRMGVSAALVGVLLFGVVALLPDAPPFPELVGPSESSPLPEAPLPTAPGVYATGSNNGIALLVRDPSSSWLGLVHGLKSIGVPLRIVATVDEALQHKVVMVYPTLTGANTAGEDLQKLALHVRNGGTLIGFAVIGGGMPEVFGFGQSEETARHKVLQFQSAPITANLIDEPVAATIRLGDPEEADDGMPGTSYSNLKLPAVALFDDGSAAITYNLYQSDAGTGHAYAFGLDLGHFILRAENGRFFGATSTYVNDYQPQVDTFLRLLAAIYREGEPDAVVLQPAPHNKDFTALLTHDIDFTRSMTNIPAYAALESEAGIHATYFVQTKYVKDYSDDVFFDPATVPILQELQAQGMEIASHSVAHSRVFDEMPIGTGTEQYPDYRPFVPSFEKVRDGSITGELRISKFLLDTLAGADVVSFRPGHLSFPLALPQLLAATGYRYSSSLTANDVRTHLPFRLMDNRAYTSEVATFEFPVTIEDEAGRLGDRFDDAVALTERIAQYRGLVNILIHPDVLDHKFEFERRYIEQFRERAWFSTVAAFGSWWAARDSVRMTVTTASAGTKRLVLAADGTLEGLTLEVPSGWTYRSGLPGTTQQDAHVVLAETTGEAELLFDVASNPP